MGGVSVMIAYYWKEPFPLSLAYIFQTETLYFMAQSIKIEPENFNNTEIIMEHNYELDTVHRVQCSKWVFEAKCIHVQRINEMYLT